jgi:hypothetical protein
MHDFIIVRTALSRCTSLYPKFHKIRIFIFGLQSNNTRCSEHPGTISDVEGGPAAHIALIWACREWGRTLSLSAIWPASSFPINAPLSSGGQIRQVVQCTNAACGSVRLSFPYPLCIQTLHTALWKLSVLIPASGGRKKCLFRQHHGHSYTAAMARPNNDVKNDAHHLWYW